jgi:ribulose-5-phosphate 4-epimerase/fuculose-1-phosphate aldolase
MTWSKCSIRSSWKWDIEGEMRIRFSVAFREIKLPDDRRIRELREWCVLFHRLGLAPLFAGSSLGNLSFRLKKGAPSFIITASETGMKDDLADDAFVAVHECDMERCIVYAEGTRNPSSESMLHDHIYRRRPEVNAIFHGHSELILSSAEGLSLPVTPREDPYGSPELVESVTEILDDLSFFVLKNHGFMALGKTMQETGERAVAIYLKSQEYQASQARASHEAK